MPRRGLFRARTEEIDLSQDGFISFEELKEFLRKEAAAAGPIPQAPRGAAPEPRQAPELAGQVQRCRELSEKNVKLLRDLNSALAVPEKG